MVLRIEISAIQKKGLITKPNDRFGQSKRIALRAYYFVG
jgi:hypothetical protein